MIFKKIYSIPHKIQSLFFPIWNRMKFKIKGVAFGSNFIVYNRMYLEMGKEASITIGDNFIFTSGSCINPLCRNLKGCIVAYPNASIRIGNNVGMSSTCLWAQENISIGNHVKIGGDCIVMDSDAHSLNFMKRRNPVDDMQNKRNAPIIIEDDVLIGTRTIILKGVTIGARSVIGAGSVVTKSIPADCIAAGNPCKVIKHLNN